MNEKVKTPVFRWLKKRNGISIEQQLNDFLGIGIGLKEGININECLDFNKKEYKIKPYFLLLTTLGSEIVSNDKRFLFPSDDVWYLDRECIEDNGDYVRVIRRIAEMTKDDFSLDHINDFIDLDNKCTWISFKVNGHGYKFDLNVNDDWLDIRIFEIFSILLLKYGSKKRFFFSDIDPNLLVVLIEKEKYRRLNELLNIFIPAHLGEGRSVL